MCPFGGFTSNDTYYTPITSASKAIMMIKKRTTATIASLVWLSLNLGFFYRSYG